MEVDNNKEYMLRRVLHHYTRAIAYAVTDKIAECELELQLFFKARKNVHNRRYGNNTCEDVFNVAEAMIYGELLYRKK